MILQICYCAFLILLVLTLVCYIRRYRAFKDLKCDGPFAWPIIGNMWLFRNSIEYLNSHITLMQKYNSIIKITVGVTNAVIVLEPELINVILHSPKFAERAETYNHLKSCMKNGLLATSGAIWSEHRKLLNPAFKMTNLKRFVSIFESNGDILMEQLQRYADGRSFDIDPLLDSYSLDSLLETSLGTNSRSLSNKHEYDKCVKTYINLIGARLLNLLKIYEFTYKFTPDYWKMKSTLKKFHKENDKIIRRSREAKLANDDGISFIDILLNSSLSDSDIKDEVNTITAAGFETVGTALTFCLYEIARNPMVQDKIFLEIKSIVGDNKITYSDLRNLRYLEMAIKEVLRLHPSVVAIGRYIREDITCDWGTLKANTNIMVSTYMMHRNPKFFPNPDVFDPERFSEENISCIKSGTYIPFSGGPRICIGQKYAMMSMKLLLSKIITSFKILPDPDFVLVPHSLIVLRSLNGMRIKLQKRNQSSI